MLLKRKLGGIFKRVFGKNNKESNKIAEDKEYEEMFHFGAFTYNFSWVGCSLLQAVQEKTKIHY